ncbi:hypothetical protein ACU70A_06350 [Syntrophomonas erecta subsp. sporosyntropha]
MDEAKLLALLKTTGLPVAYHHFTSPPSPPYIVYLFSYNSNFGADNKVYDAKKNFQVELYTTKKDLASEKLIEDTFDANDIYYEKTETHIESEGLFQVLYEI